MPSDETGGDGEPLGERGPAGDDGLTGERGPSGDNDPSGNGDPTDETVVQTAAVAAESVIFDRYKQSKVRDLDVTVSFEEGILDVDVYLNVPSPKRDDETDPAVVAEEATLAARDAVDELFGETA